MSVHLCNLFLAKAEIVLQLPDGGRILLALRDKLGFGIFQRFSGFLQIQSDLLVLLVQSKVFIAKEGSITIILYNLHSFSK